MCYALEKWLDAKKPGKARPAFLQPGSFWLKQKHKQQRPKTNKQKPHLSQTPVTSALEGSPLTEEETGSLERAGSAAKGPVYWRQSWQWSPGLPGPGVNAVSHSTSGLPPQARCFIKLFTEAVNIRVQLSSKDLPVR